jgi:flagellar basal body rod protein FlgG
VIDPAPADALARIAARAQDLRDAYRPGAQPLDGDVRVPPRSLPAHDPLSVVLPPDAWLVTQDADGRRAYGRDGALHVADDGTLRTSDDRPVLGYPGGSARAALPVPLRVPDTDRVLGRTGDLHVDADGTLAYTRLAVDPRTATRVNERVTLGRIALARFPAGTQPLRRDGVEVGAPPGVTPHLGTPADGTFGALVPFRRDAGSVDLLDGVTRLNEAYRAFEALGAVVRTRTGMQKTTLDLVK